MEVGNLFLFACLFLHWELVLSSHKRLTISTFELYFDSLKPCFDKCF